MDNSQDRIPVWVGRAVTTAEVPVSFDGYCDERLGTTPDQARTTEVPEPGTSATKRSEPLAPSAAVSDIDVSVDNIAARDAASEDFDHFDSTTYDAKPDSKTPDATTSRVATGTKLPLSRLRFMAAAVAGALVLIAGGLVLSGFLGNRSQQETTEIDTSTEDVTNGVDGGSEAEQAADYEASETTGWSAAVGSDSEVAEAEVDPEADNGDLGSMRIPGVATAVIEAHRGEAWTAGESAWAVYIDGKIYLQGQVPDDEAAEVMTKRLQSILGPENVISQYTLDPTSPPPTDPPLFIKETVVFAPQSTTMPPGSDWILVMADVLMKRFPATTLTVVTDPGTGDPGDSGEPGDLTDDRVAAIIGYLVDRGIDSDRLESTVRTDDLAGAEAGNKPIEFVVRGLLEDT